MMFVVIVVVTLVVTALVAVLMRKDNSGLPPGPRPWPILGNLPSLFSPSGPHRAITRLARQYGGILRLWFGDRLFIVFSDPMLLHETAVKKHHTYAGRVLLPSLKIISAEGKSLTFSNGERWTQLRRVAHSYFGTKGGVCALEARAIAEKDLFFKWLDRRLAAENGQLKQDLGIVLRRYTLNVISKMTYSHRYQYDEHDNPTDTFDIPREMSEDLIQKIEEMQKVVVEPNLADSIWWMEYVPGSLGAGHLKKVKAIMARVFEVLGFFLQMHKDTLDENNVRDFMDHMLIQAKSVSPLQDDETIVSTAMEMVGAGTDTVGTTLTWIIVAAMCYPELQKKVQKEIDTVVGRDRDIVPKDAPNLPYLNAFIKEAMRWKPASPFGIPHRCTEDDVVNGYKIPKDAIILLDLFGASRNEKVWENPEEFNPDRFLPENIPTDPTGKLMHKMGFIPFGCGTRACLGQKFARQELFLFAAHLFQNYTVEGKIDPTDTMVLGVVPKEEVRPIIKRRH
jgi:cytochrome P450